VSKIIIINEFVWIYKVVTSEALNLWTVRVGAEKFCLSNTFSDETLLI